MDVRILGRVEVHVDGGPVRLPGRAAPAVVAMLALRVGQVVRTDELIDGLWESDVPAEPRPAIHVTISRLRAALGPGRTALRSTRDGYALDLDPTAVDAWRAERAWHDGVALAGRGDAEGAIARLTAGLGEWRTTPLVDLADLPFANGVVTRLHLLRLDLVEARNDALLAVGRAAEVLDDAEDLLDTDPWRERLVGQLMLALYRCNRQADALAAYARLSSALRRDLGVDPQPETQVLHERILRHDRHLSGAKDDEPADLPGWFRAALDADHEDDIRVRFRLLLALGEAQHHAGETGWRATLVEAGAVARQLDDPVALARVACAGAPGWGLDGLEESVARIALIDAALAAEPALDPGWRARLLAAKAVEVGFRADLDDRLALGDEALVLAQDAGEPMTLLTVVTQRFAALWAPQTRDDRRRLADQAITLAGASGRPTALAFATGWAMAVAVEDADAVAVDRHLVRFEELARESEATILTWGVLMHRSWRAVIDGDLARAELLRVEARDHGARTGRPEARVVAEFQRVSIRWADDALGPEVGALAALAEALPGFGILEPLLALARHGSGDPGLAGAALEGARADGFAHLHVDQSLLATMVLWADLARRLHDRAAAEALSRRLAPFADHVVFTGTSVFGPVSQALGELAAVVGDADGAGRYLRAARRTAAGMRSPLFARRAEVAAAGLGIALDR